MEKLRASKNFNSQIRAALKYGKIVRVLRLILLGSNGLPSELHRVRFVMIKL